VTFLFGAPGKGLDLYHIGLTVPDLRAAMEQYSDAFGFGWATVRESTHAVVVDGEQRQAQIAVTYSVQGPPYLELIEERRGAVWGADGLALTHVGFWAEDVSAAMRALDASGIAVQVQPDTADGRPLRYSYHRFGGGLWLELVHPSFEADLTGWIAKPWTTGTNRRSAGISVTKLRQPVISLDSLRSQQSRMENAVSTPAVRDQQRVSSHFGR